MTDDIREELEKSLRAISFRVTERQRIGGIVIPVESSAVDLWKAIDAVLASPVIARIRAEAWDEAMAAARSVLARRAPQHYETDIDLIVEPNPHRTTSIRSESGDDRG